MLNHPRGSLKLTSSVNPFMGGPPLRASSYGQRWQGKGIQRAGGNEGTTYQREEGTVNGKDRMKGNVKKKRKKNTVRKRHHGNLNTLTPAYISACLQRSLKVHFASETKPRTSKCLTASKRTIGSYLHPHWLFIRPVNQSLLENMPSLNICSLEYSFPPPKRME